MLMPKDPATIAKFGADFITADLYHVKADWPHQDTISRTKTNDNCSKT